LGQTNSLESLGTGELIGVEGTSYRARLMRHLLAHDVTVIGVDRPNRQRHRRKGSAKTGDTKRPCDAGTSSRPHLCSHLWNPGHQPDAQPHLHRPDELRNLSVCQVLTVTSAKSTYLARRVLSLEEEWKDRLLRASRPSRL